jgi:3-hydroxyisobutyrate dehydrogenase-like beta-hydroxyacid dehydrogenase
MHRWDRAGHGGSLQPDARCGTDIEAVVEVISGCGAELADENRIKTMSAGEYNHGFAVEWMRKDLNIALMRPASRE